MADSGVDFVVRSVALVTVVAACRSGTGAGARPDAGVESVGVAECDAWFAKRVACIDKVDPAARAALRTRLDAERDEVRESARTAEGRAALASTCKALLAELPRECR